MQARVPDSVPALDAFLLCIDRAIHLFAVRIAWKETHYIYVLFAFIEYT